MLLLHFDTNSIFLVSTTALTLSIGWEINPHFCSFYAWHGGRSVHALCIRDRHITNLWMWFILLEQIHYEIHRSLHLHNPSVSSTDLFKDNTSWSWIISYISTFLASQLIKKYLIKVMPKALCCLQHFNEEVFHFWINRITHLGLN